MAGEVNMAFKFMDSATEFNGGFVFKVYAKVFVTHINLHGFTINKDIIHSPMGMSTQGTVK